MNMPRTTTPHRAHTLRILAAALLTCHAAARADNLWDLSLADLGSIRVTSIASGTQTPLDKAAAVATVITAEDIEAIGATDLDQVLETVPGLHVNRSDQAFTPKYTIRGISSTYNPQTLMMINGVPITSLFVGNRGNIWAGMPVKSIARVEVIRGPGSALYGADAFAGVINIVTKTRDDINGTRAGARLGSFDTRSAWLEYGGAVHDLDVALTLETEDTHGWKGIIGADRQTVYDGLTGSHAGEAAGPEDNMRKSVEARLDVSGGNTRLRMGYQGRYDVGSGPGYFEALDHDGRIKSERFNSDVTWTLDDLLPDWHLESRASYYRGTQEEVTDLRLLPRGTVFPLNNQLFANGLIGNPAYQEQNARLDLNALFKGFAAHYIRVGAGLNRGNMFSITESKNFTPLFTPRPGGIEDVSNLPEVYLPEKQRRNNYVYVQDEWKLDSHWQLTSGLRHDRFSDFGNTTNPRMALVWAPVNGITTRLLYGRAFRAPSFAELYVTSNPINLGNPNLRPEVIDNLELAFSQQVSAEWQYTANIYRYALKDLITFVADGTGRIQAQNVGRRLGHGLELDVTYAPSYDLRLIGNYAWQVSEDRTTGAAVGEAPGQEAYLRAEWLFRPDWHLDSQVTWIGKQKRAAGDAREAAEAWTTLDVTLRKRDVLKNVNLAVSARNLLDAKVLEPSPGPGPTIPVPAIPGDFPMAGRNVYVEGQYRF